MGRSRGQLGGRVCVLGGRATEASVEKRPVRRLSVQPLLCVAPFGCGVLPCLMILNGVPHLRQHESTSLTNP